MLDLFLYSRLNTTREQRNQILGAAYHLDEREKVTSSMKVLQKYFPGIVVKHVFDSFYMDLYRAILERQARQKWQNQWKWSDRGQEGTFGKVLISEDNVIARKISKEGGLSSSFCLEVGFLDFVSRNRIPCPFIISYQGYCIGSDSLFLDMAYHKSTTFTDTDHIFSIAFQLFAGIAYMHKYRICHSDLKKENMVYDKSTRTLKLVDFGMIHTICDPTMTFSKQVSTYFNESNIIGNYNQMPPEALVCSQNNCSLHRKTCFNSSIDIWNIGLIVVGLLGSTQKNFKADTEQDAARSFQNVVSRWGSITREEWNKGNFDCSQIAIGSPFNNFTEASSTVWTFLEKKYKGQCKMISLLDLLRKCLTPTPKDRIYARDALQHPVFDEIRYQHLPLDLYTQYIQPWSLQEFIDARMAQVPAPILSKKWSTPLQESARATACRSIGKKYLPAMACQIMYLYDAHCWQQSKQYPDMFFVPEGFEEVGLAWANNIVVPVTPTITAFVDYITPQRFMGISFLDYAVLMGHSDFDKIWQVMTTPDFVFTSFQSNLQFL